MQIKNTDVVIFGYGKITGLIINAMVNQGKKVLCITNNSSNHLDSSLVKNIEIYKASELIKLKVNAKTTIFAWRDSVKLQESGGSLLAWISSDLFVTNRSLFLSSASVYKDSPVPITESEKNLEVKVKFNDKYILEMMLIDIMNRKHSKHTNLRIPNVYGKTLDYGFIGSLLKSIQFGRTVELFDDQSITRDYIHVDDVVLAIQKLLKIEAETGPLNVSTGIGTTIFKVLEVFASKGILFENFKTVPVKSEYKKTSILSCNKLSMLIDWQPRTFQKAISEIISE
jgi:nucleoside-diphosphate-sugar epimerase